MILRGGVVIRKWRKFYRKELAICVHPSPFIGVGHIGHVPLDARNKLLVCIFGVLLVKNAVLFIAQSYASEAVFGAVAAGAILEIPRFRPAFNTKFDVVGIYAARRAFVR